MARNPFGHALHEDARDELAALVGEKGANAIVESIDVRLPTASPITEAPKFPERLNRRTSPGGYQIAHLIKGRLYISDAPTIQVAMRYAKKYAAMKGTTRVAIFDDLGNPFKTVMGEDVVERPSLSEEVLDERQMEQGLRFEVINYEPGDFGGIGKAQGEYAVYIIGDTFAIKDRLKKLGLRWDAKRKQWGLWNRYTSFGRSERGSVSSKQVEKAIDKVKAFVKDYNAEVEKGNQAALAGAGISDDPKPMTMKSQVKAIMSAQRLNKRLKKNGLVITYDFPHSVGGFSQAGASNVWVVGKTWLVKNALKRFGFTFKRMVPGDVVRRAKEAGLKKVDAGWMMDGATYDRISKKVEQHLLRVAEGTL